MRNSCDVAVNLISDADLSRAVLPRVIDLFDKLERPAINHPRKILDTTFMAGFMFDFQTDAADVEKYFNALKRAQMELDLQPEPYKQHYLKEIPERFHGMIDVRRFGPGERIVFLPYTPDSYDRSQQWMRERRLFESAEPPVPFESVVQV